MTDNHNLYSKCDVLLLAEVSEKCRNNSLKIMDYVWVIIWAHQLYVWMQLLDMTKGKLELISDADMYLLFEKTMRGRASYISKRYTKAKINI